jgi:hypothetical protein
VMPTLFERATMRSPSRARDSDGMERLARYLRGWSSSAPATVASDSAVAGMPVSPAPAGIDPRRRLRSSRAAFPTESGSRSGTSSTGAPSPEGAPRRAGGRPTGRRGRPSARRRGACGPREMW